MDIIPVVSEIIMLFKECGGLLMVLHICHYEEVDPCIGLMHYIQSVLHKKLEDEHILCLTNIQGSLRTIKTKAGSLSAGKKHQCQIPCLNGFKTCRLVFVVFFLNILKRHCVYRHNGRFLFIFLGMKII